MSSSLALPRLRLTGLGRDGRRRFRAQGEKLAPLLAPPLPPAAASASGCPDVLDLFSRRLEGEVDRELCHRMEAHVAGCPRCGAACDSLERTLALCSAASSGPVPPRVQASVRRAVRAMVRAEG